MGITIRHDAPAFAAAYGSGMAAGQQRRQKYMLDMLRQNRMLGSRMPSMRGSTGGSRAGGGRPGIWQDPLAQPDFAIEGGMGERDIELAGRRAQVTQRAAQDARARKMRLGKSIPIEWQPQYISGEELDRRDELADAERDRKWKVEDREDQQAFDMEKATRASMQREFAKLPPIPKHAPPDVRAQLQDARKALSDIASSGNLDTSREEVLKAWSDAWNTYNTLMDGVPEPTGKDAMAGDVAHIDQTTGTIYDEPIPGKTRPYRPSTDKFLDEEPKETPSVTINGKQVDANTYIKIYQNSLAEAQKWDERYWAMKDAGKSDEEIEERLGQRPTVLQNPLELMAPKQEIQDGGAPTPPPTGAAPTAAGGEGITWGQNPNNIVPIDANGMGPVSILESDPPIYVMADGTRIRGKSRPQVGTPAATEWEPMTDEARAQRGLPPEIPGEAMIGGGIPIAGGRASVDVARAGSQGWAEPEPMAPVGAQGKAEPEQVKAHATQRLKQYGYTYDNYTSSQSTLQRIKQAYPNIKSLDELPPKERKAVAHALMIRDLAEGKK